MFASPSMICELPMTSWHSDLSQEELLQAQHCLESGGVIVFPGLAFSLTAEEEPLLSLSDPTDGRSKNISYEKATHALRGCSLEGSEQEASRTMLARYSNYARELVLKVCPEYKNHLFTKRTSWRPVEIENRVPPSWRKDDRRLHVDSFPSTPTGGLRLLRVFTNIHPNGRARVWEIGEDFHRVCERFLPALTPYSWTWAKLLEILHITRSFRTCYDHTMLGLHDAMKADQEYQATAPRIRLELAPGTTWMTFTDQCSHSAHAGQHALEQTFELDPSGLLHPELSPMHVLEGYGVIQNFW